MHGTPYQALVAFILSVDKSVLLYLVPIAVCFAVAGVSMVSRGRRPLELVTMFALSFALTMVLAWLIVDVAIGRPFFRLEIVRYP